MYKNWVRLKVCGMNSKNEPLATKIASSIMLFEYWFVSTVNKTKFRSNCILTTPKLDSHSTTKSLIKMKHFQPQSLNSFVKLNIGQGQQYQQSKLPYLHIRRYGCLNYLYYSVIKSTEKMITLNCVHSIKHNST